MKCDRCTAVCNNEWHSVSTPMNFQTILLCYEVTNWYMFGIKKILQVSSNKLWFWCCNGRFTFKTTKLWKGKVNFWIPYTNFFFKKKSVLLTFFGQNFEKYYMKSKNEDNNNSNKHYPRAVSSVNFKAILEFLTQKVILMALFNKFWAEK